MSVDMLLETKWMAECLVTHGTFPFPATHIRAHSLDMSCKVAEGSKDLAALSTSIPLSTNPVIFWVNVNISNTEHSFASKHNLIIMFIYGVLALSPGLQGIGSIKPIL